MVPCYFHGCERIGRERLTIRWAKSGNIRSLMYCATHSHKLRQDLNRTGLAATSATKVPL